jgi:hypothetical protein
MKKAVLTLAVVSLFVTGALAKTQALVRKDGRRHVGLVTKAKVGGKDGYNVQMRIGEIFVPSDDVDRIESASTPLEDFQAKLGKLKASDVKGRYKLAKEGVKKGLLLESANILKGILAIDPDHERAKLLLDEVQATRVRTQDPTKLHQEYLKRRSAIRRGDAKGFLALGKWAYGNKLLVDAKDAATRALKADPELVEAAKLLNKINTELTKSGPVNTVGISEKTLLSQDDVSRVRLAEFNLKGDVVGVKFRNRVLRRFTTAMSGRDEFESDKDFGRKFMGLNAVKKLQYIMDPTRDLDPAVLESIKADIVIESDPIFMRKFRSKIWPIVKQNCATMRCHGAPEGVGGLKLFNAPSRDVKIIYTNFAILAGSADKNGVRLLDRDANDNSLLLEYLLPSTLAKYPHPKTKNPIRNLFRDRERPAYKLISEWISSLASPGYPDYRLKYKPPFGMKLNLSGGGGTLPPRERRGGGLKDRR